VCTISRGNLERRGRLREEPTRSDAARDPLGGPRPLRPRNNAVYLEFFEKIRIDYWRALAALAGIDELEAGDVPGARYVIAETTVRFKKAIFFEDTLHGAAYMRTVGNRSYTMDFELRTGKTFESGTLAAEGSAAHVFFDPVKDAVQPRPDWFLEAIS
jgi:acyl-CoA thioester hydrolase